MNEHISHTPPDQPQRPWERFAPPPAPDRGPELIVRVGAEDEVAATRLNADATARGRGLGTAMAGGLLMLIVVTAVLAASPERWKAPTPRGLSLALVLGIVALFAALGWAAGAWLLPAIRRWAAVRHARRMLRRSAGCGPPDGGGKVRVVLGERALLWSNPQVTRHMGVSLLRGMLEDRHHLVLRFGLATVVVLPRRDLSADQEGAVRDWVARHAREGRA